MSLSLGQSDRVQAASAAEAAREPVHDGAGLGGEHHPEARRRQGHRRPARRPQRRDQASL